MLTCTKSEMVALLGEFIRVILMRGNGNAPGQWEGL